MSKLFALSALLLTMVCGFIIAFVSINKTSPLSPALIGFTGTLIGAFFVVSGWFISHDLTIKREIEAKRREQRIAFLAKSYRGIALWMPALHLRMLDETQIRIQIQEAIADVQIFGTVEQVAMAVQITHAAANKLDMNLDPLIESLRDELRRELGRGSVTGHVGWLGVRNPKTE